MRQIKSWRLTRETNPFVSSEISDSLLSFRFQKLSNNVRIDKSMYAFDKSDTFFPHTHRDRQSGVFWIMKWYMFEGEGKSCPFTLTTRLDPKTLKQFKLQAVIMSKNGMMHFDPHHQCGPLTNLCLDPWRQQLPPWFNSWDANNTPSSSHQLSFPWNYCWCSWVPACAHNSKGNRVVVCMYVF
jgi:hypothetical protein